MAAHRSIVARLGAAAALVVAALAVMAAASGTTASAKTVWLCRPGMAHDPCTPGLSTTVYSPALTPLRTVHPKPARRFDCFYVYPTVSDQSTTLANRQVDPEERSIALYQAARYSQYCRVYAPMYRQVTVTALNAGTRESPAQLKVPLRDVTAAFRAYLRHSDGRPFALIGHSQGSFVLEQMIRRVIDPDPALRARLLSAVLLGGNVLVKDGSDVGGTFRHIPACHSVHDTPCVVAYSTFDQPVPADSLFGRTAVKGEHVLCVNPATLRGRPRETVDPIFPSAPFAPGTLIAAGIALMHFTQPQPPTVWSSLPGSYTARCSTANGADVLQLRARGGAQTATPSPSPGWGLHLLDANVELGNLVSLLHVQDENWASPRGREG